MIINGVLFDYHEGAYLMARGLKGLIHTYAI